MEDHCHPLPQGVEASPRSRKLAAWRRINGFDRCDEHDRQWIYSLLTPTPEETTASMWAGVNASKKEISMSEKKQRVENFFNELEQGTASFTDEELSGLECIIIERRGRAAADAIVAPIDTAQPPNPRLPCSKISCDVHVYVEENTVLGKMEPELGQPESSSAGTGFETPVQQCLSSWEMERTTVDGCLLVHGTSNLRETYFAWKNSLSERSPIDYSRIASLKIVC